MNIKLKTRIEALVLCAVVAASVSCGSAAPDTDTITAQDETSAAVPEETTAANLDQNGFLLDDLPELNYGDREFTVFTWNEFLNEINVDEYSGDLVQ